MKNKNQLSDPKAQEFWDMLKQRCCSNPEEAVRIVMLTPEKFEDAFNEFLIANAVAVAS
jgi:hypothetical protein